MIIGLYTATVVYSLCNSLFITLNKTVSRINSGDIQSTLCIDRNMIKDLSFNIKEFSPIFPKYIGVINVMDPYIQASPQLI